MSGKGWPWDVLEMEPPGADVRAVRRAYARQLKAMDPAADIAGFEALRRAYDAALSRAEAAEAKAARQAARHAGGLADGGAEGAGAGEAGQLPDAAGLARPRAAAKPASQRRALPKAGGPEEARPGDAGAGLDASAGPEGAAAPVAQALPPAAAGVADGAGLTEREAAPHALSETRPDGAGAAVARPRPADAAAPGRAGPAMPDGEAPPAPPPGPHSALGQRTLRPPPDPEARARAARQRKALSLFQERAGLGLRSQAIAGLTEDADLAGAAARDGVRRALVGLLRDHLQPPFQGAPPHFGGAITRADLARIDARLGWMADHRAMRTDLGGDPVLTEAVVDLLVGRKVIEGDLARSRGWAWRVWHGLRTGSRLWTWAGLFLGFKLLQWKANTLPEWAIWSLVTVSALVLTAVFLPEPVARPLGRALRWALAPLSRWWAGVSSEIRRLLAMGLFIAGGMALLIWSQLG